MKQFSVYFFGDSICVGQFTSVHKTWVSGVSKRLEAELAPQGYETLVQNYSISGNTTRMALDRIAYDLQGKFIDLLVVQFGINDANIWQTDNGSPRVSAASFAANLQEIIDRMRHFYVSRIILNTNHATGRHNMLPNATVTYQANIARYNEIIREVAAKNAPYVTLVDMEALVAAELPENAPLLHVQPAPDVMHLSDWGHEVYLRNFYPRMMAVAKTILAE